MSSGTDIVCAGCGEQTPAAGRFCIFCAAPLQQTCPNCGEPVVPGARFCMQCATPLAGQPAAQPQASPSTVSERRLVTVLFADLVGFTSLSEHRDPEEVRDLLSQYFDRCRSLIARYGGTVEKFIGDAVMAVWGTPVTREDDAERAVRTALALTQAVTLLGEEVGMPELRVRAGVLTGNAAVEVGAEAEGMVLGDTVNTASRLQSIAEPGTVLVDDVTRRASEAAIAYEDAGEHEVKGREQSVRAWTALRVVAGAGGAQRGAGLEAPFMGRSRELQTLIETFESTAEDRQARQVTVIGDAGMGKSRLLWEFYKYTDGVERLIRWHQGRCLAYGEGVAYWALGEMVRSRAGIVEEEDPASAREKLRASVEEFVPDARERRLVEPRLLHLLGLEQRTATDRADLFSGWRLFFERIAAEDPVVLVFEDLHWGDSGLLDFIDYLLEWSAEHPIFILALGRPELLSARPEWEATITLEPLDDAAMTGLLDGLVPGLPTSLSDQIRARAEGIPLYAVETVRMLLDRGLLVQDGARYRLTGDVSELDVPETLHALAAARLDDLTGEERSLLQDASVFGESFTAGSVAAIGSQSPEVVRQMLDGLVSKQILGLNDDPLSSERGQYHFLQALLRTTAYGTMSRRDRKARHLAAARHLQESWGDDAPELAEILAAHFLAAAAADPDASDAGKIRAAACDTLADAGRRALSLALGTEAQRAFDRAAELAPDDAARAALLDQAGRAALMNGDLTSAQQRLEVAIGIFESAQNRESAARSILSLSQALWLGDRLDEALDLTRTAIADLPDGTTDRASASATLSFFLAFQGDSTGALEAADAALAIAEPEEDWPTVCHAFQTIAVVRMRQGRLEEARAVRERALALALENDLTAEALQTYNNLGDIPLQGDRFRDALDYAERGRTLALARGDRRWDVALSLMISSARVWLGEWEDLPFLEAGLSGVGDLMQRAGYPLRARMEAARGETSALTRTLAELDAVGSTSNTEYAASATAARAITLRGLGDDRGALEIALDVAIDPKAVNEDRRDCYLEAGQAALALGEEATVERMIDFVAGLPPSLRSPVLRALAARFSGLLAKRRGDAASAEQQLDQAITIFREIEAPFVLGQVLTEKAELLADTAREDEVERLASEAAAIFMRLRAQPWLDRVGAVREVLTA